MSRPGRPEQPLDASGPLAELARELRRIRGSAGLTYSQLAVKTGLSVATLRAAAGGKQLPTWKVARAFITGCGGDEGTGRQLWSESCRAKGRPVPEEPPALPPVPGPGDLASAPQFIDTLKTLRTWAGDLSLAELSRRGAGQLPTSTVSDVLHSQRLPRLDFTQAFVRACGLNDDQAGAWELAWATLRSREGQSAPAAPEDPLRHTHPERRRLSLAIPILCLVVVLALIATVFTLGATGYLHLGAAPPIPLPQGCTRTGSDGPVVFAVSGRQDSPAPVLTHSMQCGVFQAMQDSAPVGIVDLDGHPRQTASVRFRPHGGENRLEFDEDVHYYLAKLSSLVASTRATSPHADVLGALAAAAQMIDAAGNRRGGTLYLEDSGLQDTAPLNFTQPGMLSTAPDDVASFLARQRLLPDLHGITVVLVSIGDTAPPQSPLTRAQQANLTAIWSVIAEAGGATSVVMGQAPLTGHSPAHVPDVTPVPVPRQPGWSPADSSYTFADAGPVGFDSGTTIFRDPAAAQAQFRPLAHYLIAHPTARVELTGTTAHAGSLSLAVGLSEAHAEAVKAALVADGANPVQITTRGLGWHFPGYVNDQGPRGTLLPGPAELNRSVIITKL